MARISRVLDKFLEISETKVVLQNNIANDNTTLGDSLLCSIESCSSQLHELIVRGDENIEKYSWNTSSAKVRFCGKSLVLVYSCPGDQENRQN